VIADVSGGTADESIDFVVLRRPTLGLRAKTGEAALQFAKPEWIVPRRLMLAHDVAKNSARCVHELGRPPVDNHPMMLPSRFLVPVWMRFLISDQIQTPHRNPNATPCSAPDAFGPP
jgi:hypothetical protein